MAAAVTKLQLYPHGVDQLCFKDRRRTALVGPGFFRFRMQRCRAFMTEDGGGQGEEVEKREMGSERKLGYLQGDEVVLKERNWVADSLRNVVYAFCNVSSRHDNGYREAVIKLEEAFFSVSFISSNIILLFSGFLSIFCV